MKTTPTTNGIGPGDPAVSIDAHSWMLLDPGELRRLKNLFFAARRMAEGYYAGRHRSRSRGHTVEFADYREYSPGDDITDVDWKAYGRTDRLFVKLFEAQTDMVVYVLLDCSASMGYAGLDAEARSAHAAGSRTAGPLSKFDHARYLLAAMAFLLIRQGDKVGLGLFTDRLTAYLAPGGTFRHLHAVLHRLEYAAPSGATDAAAALHETFGAVRRRGLLIVVSDFLEDPAGLFEALGRYRHHKFEVSLFQILHDEELRLPAAANLRFVDSESREGLAAVPAEIREEYMARFGRHLEALRSGCAARRVDYNRVTTSTNPLAVLERYLARRACRLS